MAGKYINKVIWITGATSGIGEALAHAFANEGAMLVLSARRVNELHRVKESLYNKNTHLVLPLDLEYPDSFPALVSQVINRFNRVDIIVHNGGISQRASVLEATLEVDRKVMAVNYFGAIALTKLLLPYFLKQQTGHFVVISSLMGKFGTPLRSAYAASKHALHGFFDSLRAEVYDKNIKILMVCPGYIKTNISVNALNAVAEKHNLMDKNQELGMLPELCAAKILQAINQNKTEVLIGGKEVIGVYLKRFMPTLLNRIVRNLKQT